MSLEGKMKSGRLYCEFGHELEENKAYEQKIQNQRVHCKELVYDYNQTRPSNGKEKRRILDELLAEAGEEIWIESPAFFRTDAIRISVITFIPILICVSSMTVKYLSATT